MAERLDRFVMRLVPEDTLALHSAVQATCYSSTSDVVRAALSLFYDLWHASRNDFRVVLCDHARGERYGLALDPVHDPAGAPPAAPEPVGALPGSQLEVRLRPDESSWLMHLVAEGAAETRTALVRRALGIYCRVVDQVQDGWQLCEVSPDGHSRPLRVSGVELDGVLREA